MNKKELVSALAEQSGCTAAVAADVLDGFIEVVTNEMKEDGAKIVIPGFGQFVSKHRPSREVRNPSTGQMMMSKAKTAASFKPAAALKDL